MQGKVRTGRRHDRKQSGNGSRGPRKTFVGEIGMWKIAATGHRPNKLFGYDLRHPGWLDLGRRIRSFLLDRLSAHGEIECITGMALGVDQVFGLVALKLRGEGHAVGLFAALPCHGQDSRWQSREHWQKLLANADEKLYVHDGPYTATCMQERNIFMVKRADEIMAVWDGSAGGTGFTVGYARKMGKPVTNLLEEDVPADS